MKTLKMDQIVTGQFENLNGGTSYMVVGLSEDGAVYRYEKGLNGWVPLNMVAVKKDQRYRSEPVPAGVEQDDDIPF